MVYQVFGTLYGSFFGYEELLDPVFENIGLDFLPLKVFKQTNFILITAVAIGVALIVISMILNIYIGFKNKDYEKAIFGCNGIVLQLRGSRTCGNAHVRCESHVHSVRHFPYRNTIGVHILPNTFLYRREV